MLASGEGSAFHIGADWAESWAAAYGGATWRDSAGLATVRTHARVGPLRLAVLHGATNAHSAHYDAPAGVPLDDALPARLFAETGVAALRFDYLPEGARLLAAGERWAARHRVAIVPHALAPVVDCRRPYEAWFAARSKRIRQRLRGDGRLLFGSGATFEIVTADPVASGVLDQCLRLEQAGWKGRAGSAILDDAADSRFYTALAGRAAAAGVLRLALLRQSGRIVAFEYGVLAGRRLFLLKVGYDEALKDLSPGYVLAARHIEACCADADIDWYDKMGNGLTPAPYKLRFADGCDTLYRLTIHADDWRGRALALHDAARARAKRWRDARRQAA